MHHGHQQVRVWVRETDSFPALRNELLRLVGNEPDESTSYEGMVDFHWGFSDLADAEHVAAALSRVASRPDIVLLRLSNYLDEDASVTYKEARFTRH
jgi:hypothetical protein